MRRQLISNQPLKDDLEDLDQIDFFQKKAEKSPAKNEPVHHSKPEKSPLKPEQENEPSREEPEVEREAPAPKKTNAKRYHQLQVIDEDTENFKTKLDGLISNFRTETLNEFMSIKRNLLEDQTSAIDGETRKYSKLLENRTNELDKTKEALAKNIKELERAEMISNVLSDWAGTARTKQKNILLISRCFGALKTNKQRQETKLKNNRMLDTLYGKKSVAKLFGAWRSKHLNIRNEKSKKAIEETMNNELGELAAKYEKEIDDLKNRLHETLRSLDEANKGKEEIQDNLKRAFMRGVSALNFEAMTILSNKEGQDPQNHVDLEPAGLRKRGGSFSQENPFSDALVSNVLEERPVEVNEKIDEVPHNPSPRKNILVQHQNHNKLESKEVKWKDAPAVIPAAQNSGKKGTKENVLRSSVQMEKQENKENLTHNNQGIADHSLMPNYSSQNDEGRVIKVNHGKSFGLGAPSPSVTTGKQIKHQEKPLPLSSAKSSQLKTQLSKTKK